MRGVLGKISWRSISPSERRPADLRKAILRQRAAYDNLPLEFLELETARGTIGFFSDITRFLTDDKL